MIINNITSDKLVTDLRKYGLIERKSLNATLPILSNYLVPHLWRGIIDGDGCITKRKSGRQKGQVRLNLVGSKEIIEKFTIFCESIINKRLKIACLGNFYRAEVAGLFASKIIDYIKPNSIMYLKRKWNDN